MDKNSIITMLSELTPEQQKTVGLLICDMAREGDWMTVRTASEMLGVSPMYIRRRINEGSIRTRKISERKTLVSSQDITDLRKAHMGL